MLKRLITRRNFIAAGSGALVTACAAPIKLAEPPTLYSIGTTFPQDDVPVALRTVDPSIFYVTDRAPIVEAGQLVGYSHARSSSMVFGAAKVRFGNIDSWQNLVTRSETASNRRQVLSTESYHEIVRFPETPLPFVRNAADRIVPEPAAQHNYRADVVAFQQAFRDALRVSPRKEALIFVHGFNNQMQDGLTTTASLWHYAGRISVPVSFSWPAGNTGLTAYFKDRESGEFSTYHLKEFLRAIAAIPELQKINIVAHSRGADVVTSALREMVIFEMGAGRDPRRSLKIDTIILAAPDLDFGVVQQRLAAEGTAAAVRQITVYLNPKDGALGVAQMLATGQRVGRMSPDNFTEAEWQKMGDLGNVYFIDVENAGSKLGHTYFRDNPAVLSDVILTLRTGALPGSAERPLAQIRSNFYQMHANYPGPRIVVELKRNSNR
ncbi:alpha/beta hydrolase [Cypionkella sp. TWP1-2-1b2]|uniref:alpha/beta hydrolase n=1 Tax=Cypionkella sp. TWP1-2-1b2 TaxID=2804675 RepID=UPI003CE6D192